MKIEYGILRVSFGALIALLWLGLVLCLPQISSYAMPEGSDLESVTPTIPISETPIPSTATIIPDMLITPSEIVPTSSQETFPSLTQTGEASATALPSPIELPATMTTLPPDPGEQPLPVSQVLPLIPPSLLAAPLLISPTGRLTISSPSQLLYRWRPVAGATQYYVYVFYNTTGRYIWSKQVTSSVCTSTLCQLRHTGTLATGSYKFRILPRGQSGFGAYSAWMSFVLLPPPPPTLISPSGALPNNSAVTYRWKPVSGATQYTLVSFSNTQNINVFVITVQASSVCTSTVCSVPQPSTLSQGSYTFHVRTRNLLGAGTYSPWMAFTIQRPAATFYVRADGGSPLRCTGLVDAPDPGSGSGQPCAWDHPFRAFPPRRSARIARGDTLMIASGSYMMGLGAPETPYDSCASESPWDCVMASVPSGFDLAHPTRILGAGWDSTCTSPPQLWGTQRANFIFNMTDSSYVNVNCLEITDHSGCVESHSGGLACQRDAPPYGNWAAVGLYAEDSAGVTLKNLNIHGLGSTGVHAGRLHNWTVDQVRIAGNGSAGWDGDMWEGSSSNTGTLYFHNWTVEWNGCGETYPGGQPTGCWGQTAGGYGDGVGTGATSGQWIIEDSKFRYNTSDGLDLLYARLTGASITIRRTLAVGNAGNQIKTTGPVTIENSIIIGNCGFFHGKSFTYNVDDCRALGSALVMTLNRGNRASVVNTTLASQGDCLIGADCSENGGCNGSEKVYLRNNIFQGYADYLQPDEKTCLVYEETIPGNPFDLDYSIVNNVKDTCSGPHNLCGAPLVVNATLANFDAHLQAGSPAINAGLAGAAPLTDSDNLARDSLPDIGAYEYR